MIELRNKAFETYRELKLEAQNDSTKTLKDLLKLVY